MKDLLDNIEDDSIKSVVKEECINNSIGEISETDVDGIDDIITLGSVIEISRSRLARICYISDFDINNVILKIAEGVITFTINSTTLCILYNGTGLYVDTKNHIKNIYLYNDGLNLAVLHFDKTVEFFKIEIQNDLLLNEIGRMTNIEDLVLLNENIIFLMEVNNEYKVYLNSEELLLTLQKNGVPKLIKFYQEVLIIQDSIIYDICGEKKEDGDDIAEIKGGGILQRDNCLYFIDKKYKNYHELKIKRNSRWNTVDDILFIYEDDIKIYQIISKRFVLLAEYDEPVIPFNFVATKNISWIESSIFDDKNIKYNIFMVIKNNKPKIELEQKINNLIIDDPMSNNDGKNEIYKRFEQEMKKREDKEKSRQHILLDKLSEQLNKNFDLLLQKIVKNQKDEIERLKKNQENIDKKLRAMEKNIIDQIKKNNLPDKQEILQIIGKAFTATVVPAIEKSMNEISRQMVDKGSVEKRIREALENDNVSEAISLIETDEEYDIFLANVNVSLLHDLERSDILQLLYICVERLTKVITDESINLLREILTNVNLGVDGLSAEESKKFSSSMFLLNELIANYFIVDSAIITMSKYLNTLYNKKKKNSKMLETKK